MEEIEVSKERATNRKAVATPSEISQLRGVIGSLSWQASQTAPQFQADVGLLLSEVPYATVDTLLRTNKLVREVRMVPQTLVFPHWNVPWQDLSIVVWSDASNSNRPDKSSTMGIGWLRSQVNLGGNLAASGTDHLALPEDAKAGPWKQWGRSPSNH